jgi:hypothetical protein
MLHFRKMDIGDFGFIYYDDFFRPLITVPPFGEKFGIVIEDSGSIEGGLTGYIDGQGAMIQMTKVKEGPQQAQFKEGLIRAAIYMLDRQNIKFVFSKDYEGAIYSRIGFIEMDCLTPFVANYIGDLIIKELQEEPFRVLEVESFFNDRCC